MTEMNEMDKMNETNEGKIELIAKPEPTENITISLWEYNSLKEADRKHDLLRKVLWDCAGLDYKGEEIGNIDNFVTAALKVLYPMEYSRKLRELQEARNEKDKERCDDD